MDLYERSEKYKKLMDTVIEEHEDLAWIQGMVSIDCLAADKQKKSDAGYVLGECIRVKDVYREYCPYDFLIVIYEKNCAGMTEEQLKILMYHELLHVDVGEKMGNRYIESALIAFRISEQL
ncbi:MAG: putative metallopeptidase [Eubacteriales bacterium]|nr:putative metallopeptidase [Eubacteriales bacterium]